VAYAPAATFQKSSSDNESEKDADDTVVAKKIVRRKGAGTLGHGIVGDGDVEGHRDRKERSDKGDQNDVRRQCLRMSAWGGKEVR